MQVMLEHRVRNIFLEVLWRSDCLHARHDGMTIRFIFRLSLVTPFVALGMAVKADFGTVTANATSNDVMQNTGPLCCGKMRTRHKKRLKEKAHNFYRTDIVPNGRYVVLFHAEDTHDILIYHIQYVVHHSIYLLIHANFSMPAKPRRWKTHGRHRPAAWAASPRKAPVFTCKKSVKKDEVLRIFSAFITNIYSILSW